MDLFSRIFAFDELFTSPNTNLALKNFIGTFYPAFESRTFILAYRVYCK
jgi:hypothetical protein